ncbi:MAG: hypothetical protein HQL46_08215, partial [Gammaproteobacteria bacterium]|nr:hypothetical protein [Gammaproteobacteria bacterium]
MQGGSASVKNQYSDQYPQFGTIPASRLSSSPAVSLPVYETGSTAESFAPKTKISISEEAKEKLREEQKLGNGQESKTTSGTETGTETQSASGTEQYTADELKQIEELKKRDEEVRAHEQAHMAAAGSLSNGSASFDYQNGPDGKRYAVG